MTLPQWGRIFHVEADITVTTLPNSTWTNVICFSKNGNWSYYSDRIPAIFIHKDNHENGYLYIQSESALKQVFYPFELGKKYHIVIQQKQNVGNQKIMYKVEVNGDIQMEVENTKANIFNNVQLYINWGPNALYPAFSPDFGLLENLKYIEGAIL